MFNRSLHEELCINISKNSFNVFSYVSSYRGPSTRLSQQYQNARNMTHSPSTTWTITVNWAFWSCPTFSTCWDLTWARQTSWLINRCTMLIWTLTTSLPDGVCKILTYISICLPFNYDDDSSFMIVFCLLLSSIIRHNKYDCHLWLLHDIYF